MEKQASKIHVSCFQGSLLPNTLPPPAGAVVLGSLGESRSNSFFIFLK